jgi:hypothetical protein
MSVPGTLSRRGGQAPIPVNVEWQPPQRVGIITFPSVERLRGGEQCLLTINGGASYDVIIDPLIEHVTQGTRAAFQVTP